MLQTTFGIAIRTGILSYEDGVLKLCMGDYYECWLAGDYLSPEAKADMPERPKDDEPVIIGIYKPSPPPK